MKLVRFALANPYTTIASIGRVQAAEAQVTQARLAKERVEQRITAEVVRTRDDALTIGDQS